MTTKSAFNRALSGTSKLGHAPFGQLSQPKFLPKELYFEWGAYGGPNSKPFGRFVLGREELRAFERWIWTLAKLNRQHNERLAAVSLDDAAQRLLKALDRETSIKWEDLPERAEAEWRDAARAAAILAVANLCDASPTRIRLSEYGDKLLAESSQAGKSHKPVEV